MNSENKRDSVKKDYDLIAEQYAKNFGTYIEDLDIYTVFEEQLPEKAIILDLGAGIIGNYTFCSTSTKTVGTFIPNDEANPYIGEKNKIEYVEEDKLEVICGVEKVKMLLKN